MPRPLKELGGKDWEQLGLVAVGVEPEPWTPTWEVLVPLLPDHGPDALCNQRLALVWLEGNDPEAAACQLRSSETSGASVSWLLFQIALHQLSEQSLQAWLGAASGRVEQAVGAFIRVMLLGGDGPLGPFAGEGEAFRLGRMMMLARLQRWEDLADLLAGEGSVAEILLAATLRSGELARTERQAELLERASADVPLFATDAQMDRALPSGDLAIAIARRIEALDRHPELVAEASATRVVLQLHDKRYEAAPPPALNVDQAAAAWRHLTALLARKGAELVDWYRETASSTGAPLAGSLLLRAAGLLVGRGEWARALESLPQPGVVDGVLEELANGYRLLCLVALERWGELSEALADLVDQTPEGEQRALVATLAAVTGIQDGGLSKGAHTSPLSAAAQLTALRRGGRADEAASFWHEIHDVLASSNIGGLIPFGSAVALLKAGRYDEARQAFKHDRELAGDQPTNLVGLVITLHHRRAWGELVDVLVRLAKMVVESEAVTLVREAAHIAALEGADLRRSVELIRETVDRCPSDLNLLQEAAAINLRAGRYREAVVLLERASDGSDATVAADLLCARGKILQEKLGDPAGAEKSYRRALQAHPLHVRSLHGLYHLLVKEQRFRDLPEVLHSLLHLTKTDAGRVKLLNNLASLHLKLWRTHNETEDADKCIHYSDESLALKSDSDVAIRNLVTVCVDLGRWREIAERFEIDGASALALGALTRALSEMGQWAEAAQAFRRLAERDGDAESGATALISAGDICREHLDDVATAEECYRRAIELRPELESWKRLADLLRSQERLDDLVAALEAQLPNMEQGEQVQLQMELGRLHADGNTDVATAIKHLESALEIDSTNQEVMTSLETLLEQEESLPELARLLEERLQLVDSGPDELRILLRLGQLYREFEDEQSVLRVVTRLHHFYPDEASAVELAEEIYRGQNRFSELCELYERRAQFLEQQGGTEAEQAVVLERKGNIEQEELSATAAAAESFTRALELAPEDAETLSRLELLLSEAEDWQKLLSLYERRANHLEPVQEQIASLHQAAQVAQQKLGDEAETARLYERIHALDPSDAESFRFLESKLGRLKDDRRLAALLGKRAETVQSVDEAMECLLRAASIREKVGDASDAVAIYHRIIELEPNHRKALNALSRITEALESWEEFLEVTERQIGQERKASNKALLYFKCGSVLETKYHRDEEAIRYYTQAIETSAACLPALHSLRDLYSRREDWQRVIETLKTETSVWTDSKGKAGVLAQIADLYTTKLGDHREAFKYYREAIQNHPENMRAALALFEAYANQGSYSDAAAWGEVYARQVQKRGNSAQRAEFFVRWADVLRRIGRYEDAAQYLVCAQELSPGQAETLFGLLDLCREAPEAYEFAGAFEDLLKDATKRGDDLATAILLTACGVLSEQNGDVSRALELYNRAVSTAGHKIRLATPMADLLVLLGREDEAVELIGHCREQAKDESFSRWIEATEWLVDHEILWRHNYERAAARCGEALDEQPNRDDIRLLLAQVLVLLKQPDRAVVEYQRICDKLAKHGLDLQLLAERYHALGLAAEKAGNQRLAESSWRRATELAADWVCPPVALARARAAKGDTEAASAELAKVTDGGQEDLKRARAVLAAKSGELQRAVSLWRELADVPEPLPSDQVLLARCLTATGESAAASDLLRSVFRNHNEYMPAVEELVTVGRELGNDALARRANQVVALGLGRERPKPAPLVRKPIPKGFWTKLEKEIARNPVDALWRVLGQPLDRAFGPEPPPSSVAAHPEVQLGAVQMGALFGSLVEIARLETPVSFMLVFGNRLLVSLDVSRLSIQEVRSLLSLAQTPVKLGYGPLLKLKTQNKMELARLLAQLLAKDEEQFPRAAQFLADQPRGKQRQINRLVAQHRIPAARTEELARSWLGSLEVASIKVALLLTEDLPSLARVLALKAGIPLDALDGGGLPGAVPGLPTITEYFLSDDYQQMRGMLSVEDDPA